MKSTVAKRKTFVEGIKDQFSTKTLVLIPISVGINLVGGMIASSLKLPLFLDMIGTILSAALGGPWVAALVGFLTNIFLALVSNPVYLPYSLVSVGCGLVAGFMIRGGLFKKWWGIVLTCIAVTLISVIISSTITVLVFGGATGATGSSILTATLIAATQNIIKSVVASSFIENLADRAIAFVLAYIILKRIPKRFLSQYSIDSMSEDNMDDDEQSKQGETENQ
ncbi:MAG: ECF transporter S component [Treponema sp.]|jgi:energy-coupling factor transport system substrate-specific component|nr:ECF transporter S component [Treponema sp.]